MSPPILQYILISIKHTADYQSLGFHQTVCHEYKFLNFVTGVNTQAIDRSINLKYKIERKSCKNKLRSNF